MYSSSSTIAPLTLASHEVEEAFMAACAAKAIRDPEELASLSQAVCFWYWLNDKGRGRVLRRVGKFMTRH